MTGSVRGLRTLLRAIAVATILVGVPRALVADEAPVAEPRTITLREAVAVALSDSPRSVIARSDEIAARARRNAARASWLPLVQVNQNWARSDNPVFVFGSLLEQGRFGPENFDPAFLNHPDPLTNYRLSLDIRWTIFDQLGRYSKGQQAELGFRDATNRSRAERQAIRFDVVRAFNELRVATARLAAAHEAVSAAESDDKRVRDRVETGLLVESEALAAEVQLADFRQQEISARGALAIARANLAVTIGIPARSEIQPAESTHEHTFEAGTLDDALATASEQRAEIESARIGLKNASLNRQIASGRLLPRIESWANFGGSSETRSSYDHDQTVGVTLSWSVLEPGRLSRIAEARAHFDAANASKKMQENAVELDALGAWHGFLAARERLQVGERSVSQADATMRIVRDRHEQGLTTITEVLRAQTALLQARLSRIAARADYETGYANLLRATGTLEGVDAFE